MDELARSCFCPDVYYGCRVGPLDWLVPGSYLGEYQMHLPAVLGQTLLTWAGFWRMAWESGVSIARPVI